MAGIERQKYVLYNERFPEKVEAKRVEMTTALAKSLNRKFPGLELTPTDVVITWKRIADGDEQLVTLQNMFGGFQVGVIIPKAPLPGLTGEGDAAYQTLLSDVRRLAGVTVEPKVNVSIAAGSSWSGTLTISGYDYKSVLSFSEARGGLLRGTLKWNQNSYNYSVGVLGHLQGKSVEFVTTSSDDRNTQGGVSYIGTVNGDIMSGRWSNGSRDGGNFTFTKE